MATKKTATKKTAATPAEETVNTTAPEETTSAETQPENTETQPEEQAPPVQTPTTARVSARKVEGPIFVILEDGSTREYSRTSHGEHYATMAQAYHENKPGSKIIGN